MNSQPLVNVVINCFNGEKFIKESIESGNSVWIAQSEGRSKDAIDTTDPALIKMLSLAKGKGDLNLFIQSLNIVPLSISYEFDPCDVLKAKELTIIESGETYQKPEGEDLISEGQRRVTHAVAVSNHARSRH